MLSKIYSATVNGITAVPITVETDLSRGLPYLKIVGLADLTVKEAKERIRAAIINSGMEFPMNKITINMAPASIRKKGSHFDLAIAIGILASAGQVFDDEIQDYCFIGELSLDGSVNKTKGVLPMVMAMKEWGIKKFIIPYGNREEAALIDDIEIYPASSLEQVIDHFNLNEKILPYIIEEKENELEEIRGRNLDFADVKGQEYAKRAITISVAGGHGILMMGSPSTGKTMISERIPSIMPTMTYDEIVQTTMIYSVAGMLTEDMPFIKERPFRTPHHKITSAGLLGGGAFPRPGEITLANKGVLFLDEVGEFDRNLLETLRVPLEEKEIAITRLGETYLYPADFMIVAATNPCQCGYYGDPTHTCRCSEREVKRYQNKLSGPLLDRIDMHISLLPVDYKELNQGHSKSSKEMKEEIEKARDIQRERYKDEGITLNNQLDDHLVNKYCQISKGGEKLLAMAYHKMNLNPRTLLKVKKVARTIADLKCEEYIKEEDLAEALQFREFKREM